MGYVPESVFVAMAIGFSKNGKYREPLLTGNFAFSVALKACSGVLNLRIGKAVHGQILKNGKEPDQVLYNALLKLYTKCGSFEDVAKVFDVMPD
ncbi:hypothetical protein ACJIZ3_003597 [Penstemon smallii]|uniref:Pentatricopeptide repeat-containing protein n=1 Tax=Penstemon smallii TaxID=265156 RepID=A0ABD3U9N5_9LAMI